MKAVIFDFDGTLADSEKIWEKFEPNFFRRFFPEFENAERAEFIGISTADSWKILTGKFGARISKADFLREFEKFGCEKIYQNVKIFAGVREFLEKIFAAKIPAAIASSAHRNWILPVLQRENLEQFFAGIFSCESVKNAKPAPEIFLRAAEFLQIPPENCVAFEDSKNGIAAARAAKMKVGAFSNSEKNPENLAGADFVFKSWASLDFENVFPKD